MTYGIIIVKEWFDIGKEMQDKWRTLRDNNEFNL